MMAMTSSRVIWSDSGGCSPGGSVVVVVGTVLVVVVGGAVVVVVVVVVVVLGTVVVVGRGTVVVGTGAAAATEGIVVVVVEVVEVEVVVVEVVEVVEVEVVASSGAAAGTDASSTSVPTAHIAPPARKTDRRRSRPRSWDVTTRKRYRPSYPCAMSQPRLVLASGSPRRRDLLASLGLAFAVEPPGVDESRREDEDPAAFVERVARAKATAVGRPGVTVLAADTTVVLDGDVLGKPDSPEEASAMLRRLRSRTHVVVTGVALAADSAVHSTVASTTVAMAWIPDEVIAWYVATGEPLDKAGSYALQGVGGTFVEHVDGEPSNVIGLPLAATRSLFATAGLDLLSFRVG